MAKCYVIVHDDVTHTYNYVITIFTEVLGIEPNQAFALAREIDRSGRAILEFDDLAAAESFREKALNYGGDPLIPNSDGPLLITIEHTMPPDAQVVGTFNESNFILKLEPSVNSSAELPAWFTSFVLVHVVSMCFTFATKFVSRYVDGRTLAVALAVGAAAAGTFYAWSLLMLFKGIRKFDYPDHAGAILAFVFLVFEWLFLGAYIFK